MRKLGWGLALAGAALLALTACGSADRTPHLMNLRSGTDGPDEFAIVPPKALATPPDLSALPEPTPGGANLTDQNPEADAILALGGKPPAQVAGVAAGDAGLVTYASRSGRTADIRATLAAEDLQFRQKHRGKLLERWFNLTTYFSAYAEQALDNYAELARWRTTGVATPSAPPNLAQKKAVVNSYARTLASEAANSGE